MDLLPGLRDEHAGGSKRGRRPSALSTNFYRLNENVQQNYVVDRMQVLLCGPRKGQSYGSISRPCSRAKGSLGETLVWSEESQTGVREHGEANKMQCTSPPEFTPAEIIIFWRLLLEYQAEALLPDSFVVNVIQAITCILES
ncbi:hypothetical protein JG687_00016326 [Phytophthora cactorum]|uniref:Uncharacterized protein n=1 Tax=Phytophthora cactorum TaxID=29920 RepID=A0A8T1TR01_9STRA|nr:hypothetical protein JG687_00016326 [Phytophthora cactorum]